MVATAPSDHMRCDECARGEWWHYARRDDKTEIPRWKLATHETTAILDGVHRFGSNRLRALRAISQDRVDIDRVLHEFLHFRAYRPEFRDGEIDECGLKGRELPASELAEHFGFAHALQRRIDPYQIVGLGSGRKAFFFAR